MKDLEQLIYALYAHQLPAGTDYKSIETEIWNYANEILGPEKVKQIKLEEDPLLELFVVLLQQQNKSGNLPPNLKQLIAEYENRLIASDKAQSNKFFLLLKKRYPSLKIEDVVGLESEIYNLNLTLRDIPLSSTVKTEIVFFKLTTNANIEEVKKFIESQKFWISTEAERRQSIDIEPWTNALAQRVGNFQIGATRDELIRQTLFAHVIAAGMSEKMAVDFATKSVTTFKVAYFIAGHEKTEGTDNPEQKGVKYRNAFLKLLPAVLDHKKQTIDGLQNEVVKALRTSLQQRIYEISEKAYGEPDRVYAQQEFPKPSPECSEFVEFVSFLGNKGTDYVSGHIKTYALQQFAATEFGKQIVTQVGATQFGTQILANLGIQAATTTAVTTGAVETAAVAAGAAGAAAVPIVGWAALATAAVVAIAPKFKDIVSWASRKIKEGALVAAGAVGAVAGIGTQLVLGGLGLAGGLTSGIGFLVGGVAGGITYFTLQTGSPVAGFQTLGNYAAAGFSGLAGLAVVEIATPIILILLSTPIVIALLLFIINNSAYVVPPSGIPGSSGVFNPAFNPVTGSCPIVVGPIITCGSYGTKTPFCPDGHGGNRYWGNKPSCAYSIPIGGACKYNNYPNSVCNPPGSTSSCTTYGFAADVSAATLTGTPVFLPKIDDKTLNWTFVRQMDIWVKVKGDAGWGWGRIYKASDNDGNTYELYLGHLNKNQNLTGGLSGTQAGTLFNLPDNGAHVHIELKINGVSKQPDGLCQ